MCASGASFPRVNSFCEITLCPLELFRRTLRTAVVIAPTETLNARMCGYNFGSWTEFMILVAIKSVHLQQLLIGELFELGYLAHTVNSGEAVLEAVRLAQYQLIILDLSLSSGTYKRYRQALQDLQQLKSASLESSTSDFTESQNARMLEELKIADRVATAADGELVCEIRQFEQSSHKSSVPIIGIPAAGTTLDEPTKRRSGIDDFISREKLLQGAERQEALRSLTKQWIQQS